MRRGCHRSPQSLSLSIMSLQSSITLQKKFPFPNSQRQHGHKASSRNTKHRSQCEALWQHGSQTSTWSPVAAWTTDTNVALAAAWTTDTNMALVAPWTTHSNMTSGKSTDHRHQYILVPYKLTLISLCGIAHKWKKF